jgi:hypothetical protein
LRIVNRPVEHFRNLSPAQRRSRPAQCRWRPAQCRPAGRVVSRRRGGMPFCGCHSTSKSPRARIEPAALDTGSAEVEHSFFLSTCLSKQARATRVAP